MKTALVVAAALLYKGAGDDDGAECLASHYPQTRSDLPRLLNCLGLANEAVEVGVQAGVNARNFLDKWQGKRLRLVDLWSSGQAVSGGNAFYVDIANVHGDDVRRQHRVHCEARLEEPIGAGRAEIVNLDSSVAAAQIEDGSLDFVYLDARHDFAGVVTDIHAWWPKVRTGGVFAGHDYVDGEFPEGDFFWISALKQVLPGIGESTNVIRENNLYPSFFIVKTPDLSSLKPQAVDSEAIARLLYGQRSRYFQLWQGKGDSSGESNSSFIKGCFEACSGDCEKRALEFIPTRTAGSTLRPFACGQDAPGTSKDQGAEACAAEVTVDVQAYKSVCLERCRVTCEQRLELFTAFGAEMIIE